MRAGRRGIERRAGDLGGHLLEGVGRQVRGEQVHRHVDQHRTRPAVDGQVERALDDARQIGGAIDPVDPLAERPVDLGLIRVLMEVELLVRMAAVVVGRHVAGDHHHRNRVERGVGHAGRGVGQARPEVAQHDSWLSGDPGVAVGRVRGDLLVAAGDEADAALAERIEHGDVGVTAQAEDDLDPDPLEVLHQQIRRDPSPGRAVDLRLGR